MNPDNNCLKSASFLDKTYDPSVFESDVYEQTIAKFSSLHCTHDKDKATDFINKTYSILMPPPNVTGTLHLGHALTYTIQDILIRYHRQNGYDVLWQPGVDHAGIAMQMVVDRKLREDNVDPTTLNREEFINKIFEWKEKFGNIIVDQQKLLGCSATWDKSHFTMDEHCSKAVIEAFVQLYEDGLIYKDKCLINWDTRLETAISDLEIINKEEKGKLWYLKYTFENNKNQYILVATSRPETIFADVAIAVNPDDERYSALIGKKVIIPVANRAIPIIADNHADKDKGSGCVKITPAHDHNDFEVGKRHNLELISILDNKGHMKDCEYVPDPLKGLYLVKARKIVLDMLQDSGSLDHVEEIVHTIPYGDRTNTVIEPMLTEQWFVDAPKLAEQAILAVESGEIKFYPSKWENTYFDWMRNIRPWCISRQIMWGHRIPAYYTPNGDIIVARNTDDASIKAAAFGYTLDQLHKETDVLDTWFSSGLWAFETLGWPNKNNDIMEELAKYYPTSTLVTGFDIIFFWVARMIMLSIYFRKQIPFRDIYVHALIRDEKGQKMSKSKGNVIDPIALMNEFGADALRFTMAFMSVPGRDIKLSRDNVKISRNFITKIWNAARFLQMSDVKFDECITNVKPHNRLSNWILAKLKTLQKDVDDNIKEYRFDFLTRNIQYFIRDCYCDFFIEAMKFINDKNTKSIAGCVFMEFLRIINPVMPFVSVYLAQQLQNNKCDLLFTSKDRLDAISVNDESDINRLVELVHQYRSINKTDLAERESIKMTIKSECCSTQETTLIIDGMLK